MGQIRVLPASLVNRIAAGECVERPASVVKELIENALDAGASRVDVTVLDGGRGLIQVTDDGIGIGADDLALAVTPHATSKIRADDDLFNIHTMGFRGEALASIGAVSRLRMVSRPAGADVGQRIQVDAGQITGPTPTAAAPGTTVEVHDLFYCVPARRKFLRTTQTEIGHISEQVARIALAHAGVAFKLRHQDRQMYNLAATGDRRQRIADFYGRDLADVLLPIRREGSGLLVEGLAAPPAQCRRSSKWEYVFLNGRYVRDRFVSHAVKAAYRSLIKPDEYPVVFLFITIDPGQVDVNVHPTKTEVRWRDSNYVHAQVLAALREKFLSTNLDRSLRPPAAAGTEDAYRQRVRQAMADFFTHGRAGAETGSAPQWARRGTGGGPARRDPAPSPSGGPVTPAADPSPQPMQRPQTLHDASFGKADAVASDMTGSTGSGPVPVGVEPSRAIQIHNTYLVVETDDGLMLIDQHALHERILYEEFRRRISEKPLESQRMLLPELVSVPPDRMEVLETHADTLSRLGISLTAAGPQTLAIQAFPILLDKTPPASFVRDLLDLLAERGQRPNTEALIHDLLDMMACKAAVKAGDPLTPDEIAALLARRELAERTSHCPHGRPTTLRLTLRDLERQFKRR